MVFRFFLFRIDDEAANFLGLQLQLPYRHGRKEHDSVPGLVPRQSPDGISRAVVQQRARLPPGAGGQDLKILTTPRAAGQAPAGAGQAPKKAITDLRQRRDCAKAGRNVDDPWLAAIQRPRQHGVQIAGIDGG